MKNNRFTNFFLKLAKGGLIGIAAVVPGFSGGTIACIIGCYDELIECISDFKKHPGKSFKTLLPYLLGIILFAVLLIWPITWGINNHPLPTISLFAGLLLGGIPSFYKNIQGKHSAMNIMWAILGALLILAIVIPSLFVGETYVSLISAPWYLYIVLLLMGIIASAALVIPGISGSMVLLIIGFYNPVMDTIKAFLASIASGIGHPIDLEYANPDVAGIVSSSYILPSFGLLLCFGIGIIIGFILISKLMKFLLNRFHYQTYFAIFGFIIASFIGIYAKPSYYASLGGLEVFISVMLLIIGCALSFVLGKVAEMKLKNKETLEVQNNDIVDNIEEK